MPRGRKEFERYYVHGRTSFLQKQRERLAALAEQRKKEISTSLRKNRQFMSRVEFLEYLEDAEDHLGRLKPITHYVEGMKRLLWLNMQLSAELRTWEARFKKVEEAYNDAINTIKKEAQGYTADSGEEADTGSGKRKARSPSIGLRRQLEAPAPRYEVFATTEEKPLTRGDRDALTAHRRAQISRGEQRGNRKRGGKSFAVGSIKIDRQGTNPVDGE